MTINQIYFSSRELAESWSGDATMAVISITDPGTPPAALSPSFRHVLRCSFFDAIPADEFLPAPLPGLFDLSMAREIADFVQKMQVDRDNHALLVHCEYGVSRSAAVALFAEAWTGAPLMSRAFTCDANLWVLDRFLTLYPELHIEIPSRHAIHERRAKRRAA